MQEPNPSSEWRSILFWPVVWVLLLWVIFILDQHFALGLMYYGIYPQKAHGLWGILFAPFIHGDWAHLISNSSPILFLGILMAAFYRRVALTAIVIITLSTGILVWIFGRESYHIGASGVVYGLVSFIFWTGIFKKHPKTIVLSLIIIIMYSGLSEGFFPSEVVRISWESHLFGAFSGLWVAFVLKNVKEADEKEVSSPWEKEESERPYFLPRDAFEKTKLQRYYESLYNEGNPE
jgi:membrane associated rhomboid family serine protease